MKCKKRTGYRVVLGFIIAQILSVIVGLYQEYLLPKPVSKEKTKTIEKYRDYSHCGIIRLPLDLPESKPDRVLKVTLAGFGTGVSGDMTALTTHTVGHVEALDSTMEFPV